MAAGRMMAPQQGGTPVLIMKQGTDRETGHKAQKANIMSAKVFKILLSNNRIIVVFHL